MTMAEKVDWHAMWQDERAEVKRLTDALIQAKTYGTLPKPPAVKPSPTDLDLGPVLPPRVMANLDKLKAQVKAMNPDASDEQLESEARALASKWFTDA